MIKLGTRTERTGAVGAGRIGSEVTRSVELDERAGVPARPATAGAGVCAAIGTCDVEARVAWPAAIAARPGAVALAAAQFEAAHAASANCGVGTARNRSPGSRVARDSVLKRK